MNPNEFVKFVKRAIIKCIDKNSPHYGKVTEDSIAIVWQTKVLQNNKATAFIPEIPGVYYEVTYNGDKGQLYLDVYKKEQNLVFDEHVSNLWGLDK